MTTMKTLTLSIVVLGLLTLMSCGKSAEQKAATKQTEQTSKSGWICPDNIKMFPPVDIKLWNKVPVINGRLPTNEETQNGVSLIYYDIKKTPDAKPYNMILPKLASFYNPYFKKVDTVIVIQIVQTAKDTVVGYRFLTGGNGTYNFRDFHFLTDNEIKKVTENTLWQTPLQ